MAAKDPTISWKSFLFLVVLALGLAADFRFPYLDTRPMHTDEAIQAVKFINFWKTGVFPYDPKDYHGPALHHITRAFAFFARWAGPESLTDAKLRMVVAICGMLLIAATLLAGDALGRLGAALAMLFIAVSPMEAFYSRYFIMEVPLVLFVAVFLFSCWRYSQSRNIAWLLAAGTALGLQHATKETFILNLGAAACGWVAARLLAGSFLPRPDNRLSLSPSTRGVAKPWLWILIPAVIVSVTLFSSFYQNWPAVKDSVTTYAHYLQRSEGVGHEKPWYYYLTLIFWRKDTVVWTEALIGGLGVIGMLNAFFGWHRNPARRAFLIFLSVYALALLTVYSMLSYKTPWSILGAQHALCLLAGAGAAVIWQWLSGRAPKTIAALLLAGGVYHLCLQTGLAIHEYRADLRNPYVYSHTSTNIFQLAERIRELQKLRPGGLSVQVINLDSGWPLPWYLRDIPSIGYQTNVPATLDAPVIVADLNKKPEVETKLAGKTYESSIYGLRPGVMLNLFVEKKLWEEFMAAAKPQPGRHD